MFIWRRLFPACLFWCSWWVLRSALRQMFARLVILCACFWARSSPGSIGPQIHVVRRCERHSRLYIALFLVHRNVPVCSPGPAWRRLGLKVSDIHVCRKQSRDRFPGAAVWPCSISVSGTHVPPGFVFFWVWRSNVATALLKRCQSFIRFLRGDTWMGVLQRGLNLNGYSWMNILGTKIIYFDNYNLILFDPKNAYLLSELHLS